MTPEERVSHLFREQSFMSDVFQAWVAKILHEALSDEREICASIAQSYKSDEGKQIAELILARNKRNIFKI